MNSIVYNKLVRDNIPKIIKEHGKTAKISILSDEDYKKQLNLKLLEETNEYLASGEVAELADIVEVIRAILDFEGVDFEEFECLRKAKADSNGQFKDKIFLEEVISQ